MMKLALTGNIASGKSSVQKILENKGFRVLDTDIVGHELLESMPEISAAFEAFPIYDSNGKISREKLGKLVFSDSNAKKRLENIIHPAIRQEILKFFEKNAGEAVVFVGIPLLFETGMDDLFDKSLLVYTNDSIRLERLISRNNYSPEYAQIRMDSQQSQEAKKELCDYVIHNNGTIKDLEKQVEEFIKILP